MRGLPTELIPLDENPTERKLEAPRRLLFCPGAPTLDGALVLAGVAR